jgi:hypothetical protein
VTSGMATVMLATVDMASILTGGLVGA